MRLLAVIWFGALSITLLLGGLMFLVESSEPQHVFKAIVLLVMALILYLSACWGAEPQKENA